MIVSKLQFGEDEVALIEKAQAHGFQYEGAKARFRGYSLYFSYGAAGARRFTCIARGELRSFVYKLSLEGAVMMARILQEHAEPYDNSHIPPSLSDTDPLFSV